MDEPVDPRKNQLLARLPDAEWQRWKPLLELVYLPLGTVLYESGEQINFVYYPTSGIVSMLYAKYEGTIPKVVVVGNEGVVGLSIFLGGRTTSSRAVVQSAGMGYRLRTDIIKRDFDTAGPVMHLILRYAQAMFTQIRQTVVCNRLHTLDKQLCRWLLLSLDRLTTNELVITEELLADMLGVRQERVTDAVLQLQAAGVIQYTRGHITVLDRPMLEVQSCECYDVVKEEYELLRPRLVAV